MKTVYTFHATMDVVALNTVRSSTADYYIGKYPDATHLVMSPSSHIVYAVCGSEAEAKEAKRKLEEVSVR